MTITAVRHQDIDAGHRVYGHEGQCKGLHGHTYRIHFHCVAVEGLDKVGRVVDFSVIKSILCQWLLDNWDHKMLLWEKDPLLQALSRMPEGVLLPSEEVGPIYDACIEAVNSCVSVPFNPTAENLANFLLTEIGPKYFNGGQIQLEKVIVEETRKCSAVAEVEHVR